jgi:L-alanine-DL-glutamate epimerase-like enolase superfamily enzyme
MKVSSLEFVHLDVPYTPLANKHLQYWLPHHRIFQICKIILDNGVIGWGETMPNYTVSKVPPDVEQRVLGNEAAELMWQDDLGAGVQMALFDAVGKVLNVPIYRLLGGAKVREWCPISWFAMEEPPQDWARQCKEALAQGYMSCKLKARTWQDLHAGLQAIFAVVPKQFLLTLDFNGTLWNSAQAVQFLKTLEPYEQIAIIESPIPQGDVAGNAYIRKRINRPIAMHYGSPPIETALAAEVCDGFVLGAGASQLLQQAHVAQAANKTFWIQLVGSGLTTAWTAHFGAVLPGATWPADTDMHQWESQLITPTFEIRGGYYRVPEGPGLGVDIDQDALERYRVDYTFLEPPKHIYRYSRANGEVTYYGCSKQELHRIYPQSAQPICEAGSLLEAVPDDGSADFAELYAAVQNGHVVRRKEGVLRSIA